MNILRHKKWHVRTKENVARVRRDEAKAAEEERARTERAALADNEDRVRRLKRRAATGASGAAVSSAADIFGGGGGESGAPAASSAIDDESATTKHVNLFAELEEQERTNTTVGNREYAAERKKEQDDWESKVGIMKRFAEDTKEYAKETEWWQGIPLVREGRVDKQQPDKAEIKKSTKFMTGEEKRALKRAKKKRKGRKKRRHSSSSGSSSSTSDDSEEERRKKTKLDELRKQRLVRERQEQAKAKQLFEPDKKEEKPTVVKNQIDEDRQRRYNSQFNPDLARP